MAWYPVEIPWTTKPPMGTPLRAGHWSTQGLKGVWAFNEGAGSQFFDGSGGYTGAVNSRATLTSDGLSFNGTSGTADNPNVGTGPALGPLSQSTVLAVAKTLSSAADIAPGGDSIYSERAGSGLDIFKVALVNSTTLQAEFTYRNDSGNLLQHRISAVGANNGAWHTFAATKNGSAHTIYLDGKGATRTYDGTLAFTNANIQCLIGGDAADTNATWGGAAAGAIMFVARYARALSAEEIKSLTENPYQIYQPRTIWIPVAASGGGSVISDANAGTFTITGYTATSVYTALGRYSSSADTGEFTIIGYSATAARTYRSSADAGTFAVTGASATSGRGLSSVASPGNYTITGSNATAYLTYISSALSGAYTISGANAISIIGGRATILPPSLFATTVKMQSRDNVLRITTSESVSRIKL